MNTLLEHLDKLLIAAAIGQIAIAGLNMRLDKMLNWDKELSGVSRLLQDCLLYTSPSPRDRTRSRMPSSA